MSAQTGIEWADSTFNPWQGCTKVSPACDHCYAERQTARFKSVEWGAGKPRVRTSAANWKLPERWNCKSFVQCANCAWRGDICDFHKIDPTGFRHTMCPSCNGVDFELARRRVFCASLADWLDNEVPIEWLVELLDLIRRTPNLDWLLLSKRIGRWRGSIDAAIECLDDADPSDCIVDRDALRAWLVAWRDGNPPANVWVGATVVNQAEADRDVPKLLLVSARVRFLSIEPMLGPIDLVPFMRHGRDATDEGYSVLPGLHWIIAGGESGPHARPMHPDWVRSLRDQCAAAGVPFLFKQWGEWHPQPANAERCVITSDGKDLLRGAAMMNRLDDEHAEVMYRIGKKAAGRQLDGRTHDGFPVVQS